MSLTAQGVSRLTCVHIGATLFRRAGLGTLHTDMATVCSGQLRSAQPCSFWQGLLSWDWPWLKSWISTPARPCIICVCLHGAHGLNLMDMILCHSVTMGPRAAHLPS